MLLASGFLEVWIHSTSSSRFNSLHLAQSFVFACVQIKTIEVLDCFLFFCWAPDLLQIQSKKKKKMEWINNSRLHGSKYLPSEMNLADSDGATPTEFMVCLSLASISS